MKISMYTFLFEIDSKFYAYNTLSNALIEIAEDTYKILLVNKNRHTPLQEKDLGCDELYQTLKENHMITENDRDEFLLYKSIILAGRSINILNLTIAPTMDCNYSCSYCFENCKRNIYMTEKVISSIIKFIEQYENIKNIHVVWFGGEPLLGIKQIESLYRKMILIPDKNYSFSIISNGFLISPDIIKLFKEMKLQHIQITLDGLKRYKSNPLIGIYPAFITSTSSKSSSSCSLLFNRQEKSEFIQQLYYDRGIVTNLCGYPDSSFTECSIRNKHTFTIDPEGYLYKCWEIIGDQKYAIAKLDSEGTIQSIDQKILNRYLYAADPLEDKTCSKCPYLPICFGGCPHKRIENIFKDKHYDTCTYLKGSLKEFIKIHLSQIAE